MTLLLVITTQAIEAGLGNNQAYEALRCMCEFRTRLCLVMQVPVSAICTQSHGFLLQRSGWSTSLTGTMSRNRIGGVVLRVPDIDPVPHPVRDILRGSWRSERPMSAPAPKERHKLCFSFSLRVKRPRTLE